ncbi:MAG: UbiH/UbiF/VisC/COQ6 family ubiquinone biosynthesis hydroxylase [Proteobacteria bacterium]|nr:UbiH/UbiF/VisC/COQ6 family ubiquinone biosynthesis hydroxylase [Pseudomonadota bacterium]MBW3616799.1 UbiH/UbiF/VisC/COQ6 family ubiquinone biosynthesis hydroxylase [Pseudomonadota bacterium]
MVVAGAGMTGASAALALAAAGFRVALVDPQPFERQLAPTFDGRASAIAYSSFRMLRTLGAGEVLEPQACRIEQILVTDGRAPGAAAGSPPPFHLRFAAEEIAGRSGGEPLGYMVENRRIRAALAEAVAASGVAVLTPARVEAVEVGPASARVRLADGRALEAVLVVGAEGRGSTVRNLAGIGVTGWSYRQSGVVATVQHARPHGGVAYEHFLPGGPFAILPLTENRASLVWTEPQRRAEALAAASPEAFEAHLRRRFGDFLGEVGVEGPRFTYPLGLLLAEQWTAPRVALLGDAAHAIHPIAGQGLNLGLKDVAALAETLADAGRRGEDIGAEAVVERYAAWRRFDTVALAGATDVFTRLFSNDFPPLRLARGLGLAAVNRIGPARRFFMSEAGGAVGDLPRLLRGEPV